MTARSRIELIGIRDRRDAPSSAANNTTKNGTKERATPEPSQSRHRRERTRVLQHELIRSSRTTIKSQNERDELTWTRNKEDMTEYLLDRFGWTEQDMNNICWEALRRARKSCDSNRRRFTTKLLAGWLPVCARLSKYGKVSDECCLCQECETQEHLYRCKTRVAWRVTFMAKLD